jgi:ADP-ribose pyrophosphatase YjhB (NUDIX family)
MEEIYMFHWTGATGICVNEDRKILMVLQGSSEEEKKWGLPGGGVEEGESYEECCKREAKEETGYEVDIVGFLQQKKGTYETIGISFDVYYYVIEKISGEEKIQDPDGLIYEIGWKSAEDIKELELSFPEDRDFLVTYLKQG